MDKNISARFFRVAAAKGTVPLLDTLKAIKAKNIEDRLSEVQSSLVRLERLENRPSKDRFYGDFVRLQEDNKPGMASRSTAEQALNLPAGHGLTHTAAFGFDPARNILCLQVNRSGLSTTNLSSYLADYVERGGYSFVPLVRKKTLTRLSSINNIRTLQIKVGSPDDLRALDDDSRTTKENLVNFKKTFGAKYVETVLTVGHSILGLNHRKTGLLARWFRKEAIDGRGEIETLKVAGFTEEDDGRTKLTLDLLEDLISFTEHLLLPDGDIEANFVARRALIERAFSANATDLDAYMVVQ